MDIAQLFCDGYDELDDAVLANRVLGWRQQDSFKQLVLAAQDAAVRDVPVRLPPRLESERGQRQLYAALKGIDWAFKLIHPLHAGRRTPAALDAVRIRYRRLGKYNDDDVSGALLPKLSKPHRDYEHPDRLDLAFDYLYRASPESCDRTVRVVPARRHALTAVLRARGLVVGCVAMIEREDDLDVQIIARDQREHYRLTINGSASMRDRIDEAIRRLHDGGVHLALAPEMACRKELLEHWKHALRTIPRPAHSHLRWVLVGTGNLRDEAEPRNTAALLDARTGATIATQTKQYRFDLKRAQFEGDYAFAGLQGAKSNVLYEDIQVERELGVVELGSARLAILICEDLARREELLHTVARNGVSHVLVPVLARPIRHWHWEQQAAETYGQATGAVVAVANSLVVGELTQEPTPRAASLVHTADGGKVQRAADGVQLMRFRVRDDEPPQALDDELPFAT